MKLVLRITAVIGLTHLYTLLIYRWPPLARLVEQAVNSPSGQRAYVWLMDLLKWQGAEDGETLLLIAFLLISLALACLTVAVASRLIIEPLSHRFSDRRASR